MYSHISKRSNMSNEELELILKIFEFKEIKSNAIFHQKYTEAANARDEERDYEAKFLKICGYEYNDIMVNSQDHRIRESLMNDYFLKNLGMEYPKSMTNEFKKNIIREIKLIKLGI